MAAMSQAYVTIVRSWQEGGPAAKMQTVRLCKIVVPKADAASYGDGTNTIPASVFSLTQLEECSALYNQSSSKVNAAVVDYENNRVVVANLNQATDANRTALAQVVGRVDAGNDGVWYITVKGY